MSTVLDDAKALVSGDRQVAYGSPYVSLRRIALLWSALLDHTIEPEEVALMMILLKVSRQANAHGRDNLVDIAGYAELLAAMKKEP
jgi:hypothetical protein